MRVSDFDYIDIDSLLTEKEKALKAELKGIRDKAHQKYKKQMLALSSFYDEERMKGDTNMRKLREDYRKKAKSIEDRLDDIISECETRWERRNEKPKKIKDKSK